MWEFPGGKIQDGESPEFALMRELREELDIETRPTCFSPVAFSSFAYPDFHLLMTLFACRNWQGVPQSIEHSALKWVRVDELTSYDMPPADLPLWDPIRQYLG
jgi:8-oxo-dGTP diphosphatase